jgi:hypothetical protein
MPVLEQSAARRPLARRKALPDDARYRREGQATRWALSSACAAAARPRKEPIVADHLHIDLFVEGTRRGGTQPVEVEDLGDGTYRVLYSPGLVEGVAAGDVVRLLDPSIGAFEVLRRGGNLAIKLARPGADNLRPAIAEITRALEVLGGRLDGATPHAAVWTVPAASGFPGVEAVMNAAVARIPGSGWWFGNVYDENDKPLLWWR